MIVIAKWTIDVLNMDGVKTHTVITKDKAYETIDERGFNSVNLISIIDDRQEESRMSRNNFKFLQEIREDKLNELGI